MSTLAQRLNLTPDMARSIAERGYDLIEAGDFDAALSIFEGLRLLNPEDAAAHAAVGAVLHELGRLAEAERAYETALQVDDRAVLARMNRGELRCKRGDVRGLDDLALAAATPSAVQPRAQALLKRYAR